MPRRAWVVLACLLALGLVAALAAQLSGQNEQRRAAQAARQMAYATTHLGGAGRAAIAKGGDPDAATSRAVPGTNGAEGDRLAAAAAEQAAQRAYPAGQVSAAQIAGAQQGVQHAQDPRQPRLEEGGVRAGTRSARSTALQPGVLGFTGQDYVTPAARRRCSIDRNCNQGRAGSGSARRAAASGRTNTPSTRTTPAGSSRPPGSARTRSGRSSRIRPTRAATRCTPARVSRTRRATPRRASASSSRPTAATPGASLGIERRRSAKTRVRRRRSRSIRPTGNMMYVAIARAVRGITLGLGRRGLADRGAPSHARRLQDDERRRELDAGLGRADGRFDPPAARAGSRSIRSTTRRCTRPRSSSASTARWAVARSSRSSRRKHADRRGANTDRTMFALTVKDGKVRIYATNGAQGAVQLAVGPPPVLYPYSAFFRTDDASLLAEGIAEHGAVEEADVERQRRPALRDVRLLHRPVLVRPGRR